MHPLSIKKLEEECRKTLDKLNLVKLRDRRRNRVKRFVIMQEKLSLDMLNKDLELTNLFSISYDDNDHMKNIPFRDQFRKLVKNSYLNVLF